MQPEIGACRLAPRKAAQYQEARCSVEQAEYSSLGKGRPFPRDCGPVDDGSGTELAIVETRKAYSGRVVQNVQQRQTKQSIKSEKASESNRGKEGAINVWPDYIHAGEMGTRQYMTKET